MRAPKAFLEKCGKEWFDDYVYLARQPLEDRGFEIVPFDGTFLDDFIERTVFGPDDVLVGSVEATIAFWKALGFKVPRYIGYPVEFENALSRAITICTFEDMDLEFPCFIKPAKDVKLFTGFVIEDKKSYKQLHLTCPELKPETVVYISEVIDFKSEYRCFVHKGKLVGIKHYAGNYRLFPDMDWLEEVLAITWKQMPVSYTLDIGIDDGLMYLVEINDFWAIGGYGLDGKTYVRMLVDRFQEIKYNNI